MAAVEQFASSAPGQHAQTVLKNCIPAEKQAFFHSRLTGEVYNSDDQSSQQSESEHVALEAHILLQTQLEVQTRKRKLDQERLNRTKVRLCDSVTLSAGTQCLAISDDSHPFSEEVSDLPSAFIVFPQPQGEHSNAAFISWFTERVASMTGLSVSHSGVVSQVATSNQGQSEGCTLKLEQT
jgi:hypothetical protein